MGGGSTITANLHAHAVITPLRTLAQHCKRLSPLIAAPAALLLSQGQAKAVLTYNIFESGGNVIVQTSGELNLTGASPIFSGVCEAAGKINSPVATLCTGPQNSGPVYGIAGGPTFFDGTAVIIASSVSGIATAINGNVPAFGIESSYVSNTPIVSSATFNGQSIAGLGFTTTGLIGTWTINGTSETIQVFVTPPPPEVPGPLPLLGAGAAFGWSRRLRKRIATPLSTSPQA